MNKKVVHVLGVACAVTFALGMCMSVLAAPKTMVDGQKFDPQFYAKQYPAVNDLAKGDEALLYAHYVNIGKLLNYLPYENAPVGGAAATQTATAAGQAANSAQAASSTAQAASSTAQAATALNSSGISADGKYSYRNNIFNEAMKHENAESYQCFTKYSSIVNLNTSSADFQIERHNEVQIVSPKMQPGKHYATATEKHGKQSTIPSTQVDFYEAFGMDMKDAKNNWDASMRMMAGQGFDPNLDNWVEEKTVVLNERTIRHIFYYKGQCLALQNLIASTDYDELEQSEVRVTIDQDIVNGVTQYYNFSFLDIGIFFKKNGTVYSTDITYTP